MEAKDVSKTMRSKRRLKNKQHKENNLTLSTVEEEEKLALFKKRIIYFQQMIRCKMLLRKDWRIINLLLVSG